MKVTVAIPELKINAELTTDAEGKAETVLNAKKLQRWSPEEPKLYGVTGVQTCALPICLLEPASKMTRRGPNATGATRLPTMSTQCRVCLLYTSG